MTFWTPDHARVLLPALGVMALLFALARLLLRRAPQWARLLPLQLVALTLLALELQKQLCSLSVGYNNKHLPFHFCSLFLLLLPLAAFAYGKLGERARALAAILCSGVFVLTYICPFHIIDHTALLAARSDFLGFHTVAFHLLVPLFSLLLLATDLARPRLIDLATATGLALCYCAVGYTASRHFETNFSNLYYCNIAFLEEMEVELAARIGEAAASRRHAHVASACHVAFAALSFALTYLTCRLVNRKHCKK